MKEIIPYNVLKYWDAEEVKDSNDIMLVKRKHDPYFCNRMRIGWKWLEKTDRLIKQEQWDGLLAQERVKREPIEISNEKHINVDTTE